jgi:hypothetical protein
MSKPMRRSSALSYFATLSLLFVSMAAMTGCIVGVRGHQFTGTVTAVDGEVADMSGSAQGMELGVVADFRYFRLSMPFEGVEAVLKGKSRQGGSFVSQDYTEFRALRLDLPLLSIREFSSGRWFRYPGTLVHRTSLEIWWTGALEPSRNPYWWTDLGLTYYHHNAVAVRLFAGYTEYPFREVMRGRIVDGLQQTRTWEGRAPGVSFGLDVTLFAGEHALDLLMYLLDEDRRQRRQHDW